MPDIREVYADCAASAPPLQCAYDAMSKWSYANPNSVHTLGRESRRALEDAREAIAECINAESWQIGFTPSATDACHIALDRFSHFPYVSPHEHKAVYDYVDNELAISTDSPVRAHMLANNETGELYVDEVKRLAHGHPVFTDATAAVGQIPVDVRELGVVSLAAGAHKFGGYPGIGFIYHKDGAKDSDTFPGTPPVALAVAMAEALTYRTTHIFEITQYLCEQRMKLFTQLLKIPGMHLNCIGKDRLPNIMSVRFDGINARELLTMLDVNGVYASAGSACTADSDEPSRVLLASGLTEEEALSTIRLSFCPETTPEAFSFVADALRRSVERLRALSV